MKLKTIRLNFQSTAYPFEEHLLAPQGAANWFNIVDLGEYPTRHHSQLNPPSDLSKIKLVIAL